MKPHASIYRQIVYCGKIDRVEGGGGSMMETLKIACCSDPNDTITLFSMNRFLCNHILRQSRGLYTNTMIKYSHTIKNCIVHQNTYSCKQSCGKRRCESCHRTREIPHYEHRLYELFGPCCRLKYNRLAICRIL